MRINVYSQELMTDFDPPHVVVERVESRARHNPAIVYSAVRLFLHSTSMLHHPPMDDDRSAITFWLPRSASRREFIAQTFEALAGMIRSAPPETGLD